MSVFSYNYLKGINLFEKTRTFKVVYSKVDGLAPSNPVTLNGYKIGKVQKINFNSNNTKELIVDIVINNDVKFSKTKCCTNFCSLLMVTRVTHLCSPMESSR